MLLLEEDRQFIEIAQASIQRDLALAERVLVNKEKKKIKQQRRKWKRF
jgi:hypothetical protein